MGALFRHYATEFALVSGGSTSANIAVTGLRYGQAIAIKDNLVAVIRFDTGTSIANVKTARIPAAGYIRCTTGTKSHKLLVLYDVGD